MKELAKRVARLEQGNPEYGSAGAERCFWQAALAIGRSWQPEAGSMTLAERVDQLTPLQHMGWAFRFAKKPDLAEVLSHHHMIVPTTLCGWVLLQAWMEGDDTD